MDHELFPKIQELLASIEDTSRTFESTASSYGEEYGVGHVGDKLYSNFVTNVMQV